jgi:putative ABC transport system permease protein
MEAITFLLVLIGVGDTLAAGVLERTRELGMLRAVGLRRSRLFGVTMLEGVVMGLLGLALAVITGLSLGLFWVRVQFPALVGWVLDLHLPTGFATIAAAIALLMCVLGALLPSMRAAFVPVSATLRQE